MVAETATGRGRQAGVYRIGAVAGDGSGPEESGNWCLRPQAWCEPSPPGGGAARGAGMAASMAAGMAAAGMAANPPAFAASRLCVG